MKIIIIQWCLGVRGGPNERRLINDLTANYNKLERPVADESDAVELKFGLTLQQIMDVVSEFLTAEQCWNLGHSFQRTFQPL